MIRTLLISGFFLLFVQIAQAQHPLAGAWEMVSISGVNAEGEKFQLDTTSIRETKLITPTHYILIARDKEGPNWVFNRCYVGETRFEGEKYYEIPRLSSLRIFENVTTDFTWKIEGEQFIQSGSIIRPDGKKIILDKFIFKRVAPTPGAQNANFMGTWEVKSNDGHKGYLIFTATHWMSIIHDKDKFLQASGGVYTARGNSADFEVHFASPDANAGKGRLTIDGSKISFAGQSFYKVK